MKTYTAVDYKKEALKSIERILAKVNNAHDRTRKQRTSKNVIDKINEENALFDLQSMLYTFRSRLKIQQRIPGPWEAGTGDNDGYESITIEHEGFPICEVRGTDDMSCIDDDEEEARIASEMVATARLICAAPDLLQALEALVNDIEGHPSVAAREHYAPLMRVAKEAIAKAKGS